MKKPEHAVKLVVRFAIAKGVPSILIMKNIKSEKFLRMKSQEDMICGLIPIELVIIRYRL